MAEKEMPEELKELVKEKVHFCYQCGSCVGSCPTARAIPEYNPRKMMEKLILGEWEEVLSAKLIWFCTMCHTCYEACPQGVGISHIVIELRNLATERGLAPVGFLEGAKQMAATGWTTQLTGAAQRSRTELGLPEIKAVNTEEIKKLMKSTGFRFAQEDERE